MSFTLSAPTTPWGSSRLAPYGSTVAHLWDRGFGGSAMGALALLTE